MPAAASSKKYKLFAAASGDGGSQQPPCAFFASEKGCRNGANCKFAHTNRPHEQQQAGAVAAVDSTVSSESSEGGEEERMETNEKQQVDGGGDDASSPFVKSPAELARNKSSSSDQQGAKKANKKSKKKRSGEGPDSSSSPFAAPKSKKQKKGASSSSSETPITTNQAAVPVVPKPNEQQRQQNFPKQQRKTKESSAAVPSFRTLDLPIASFSALKRARPKSDKKEEQKSKQQQQSESETKKPAAPPKPEPETPPLPLPKSTEIGRKWLKLVEQTRQHPRFNDSYDLSRYKAQDVAAGYALNSWVASQPFDAAQHAALPQCIAIDCEMCETRDPVSGSADPRALCRISIVDVETDEVLLDSLVKPAWPVSDHRTWINGISAPHLEPVQFTLRHAQAFLLSLCSQETVVLGHAIHNDLAALRWEHPCVADSACLFAARDSETATVSLRDLARQILKKEMPETHDSVHDARTAFRCLEHFRQKGGDVETVVRTPKPNRNNTNNGNGKSSSSDYAAQLFVHRIPKQVCDEAQLAQMFVGHTDVKPTQVDDIDFGSGGVGKTVVHFASGRHGDLAFDTLEGKAEVEASGRLQKKVYLRRGDYIRVRKMAYERPKQQQQQQQPQDKGDHDNKDGKDSSSKEKTSDKEYDHKDSKRRKSS